MTFEEVFNSGYRFANQQSHEENEWDKGIWSIKEGNDIKILYPDDSTTLQSYINLKNLYPKVWTKKIGWYIHPDDLKIMKFNNKLEQLIKE